MTRPMLFSAVVFALILTLVPSASFAGGNGAFVAVYNSGRAQVRETRAVTLPAGPAVVVFTDVPATLDATSIRAVAPGMAVEGIEYSYRPITPRNLLDTYVGKELSVILPDPSDANARILRKATLLSSAEGPVFAMGKEVYVGGYEALVLPAMPEGFDEKPTLTLTTDNESEGRKSVALHYLMGGLNWRADYTMAVSADGAAADLEAWATVTNTSDYAFNGADVRLVAGDVQRAPAAFKMARRGEPVLTMEAAVVDNAAGASEESFSEYHVYTLPRAVSLPPQGARQVSLFSAAGVPVKQELISRYHAGTGLRAGKITQSVESALTFENLAANRLGMPLPAGTVRVYMPTTDGHHLLAGETRLGHVPEGNDVRLVLGRSFDVSVERRQTSFKKVGKSGYEIGWAVTVKNGKKAAQDLKLRDSFPGQWEVLSADTGYTVADSAAIEFDLKGLAPSAGTGGTVINYTVRIEY